MSKQNVNDIETLANDLKYDIDQIDMSNDLSTSKASSLLAAIQHAIDDFEDYKTVLSDNDKFDDTTDMLYDAIEYFDTRLLQIFDKLDAGIESLVNKALGNTLDAIADFTRDIKSAKRNI